MPRVRGVTSWDHDKDGRAQLRSEVSDVASSGSALAGALGTALP
jgi:hypothetical protein